MHLICVLFFFIKASNLCCLYMVVKAKKNKTWRLWYNAYSVGYSQILEKNHQAHFTLHYIIIFPFNFTVGGPPATPNNDPHFIITNNNAVFGVEFQICVTFCPIISKPFFSFLYFANAGSFSYYCFLKNLILSELMTLGIFQRCLIFKNKIRDKRVGRRGKRERLINSFSTVQLKFY